MAGQGGVHRTGLLRDGISLVECTIYVLIVCVFRRMVPWVALDSASRLMTWHASACGGKMVNGSGVLGTLWELAPHRWQRLGVAVEAAGTCACSVCVPSGCSSVVTGVHGSLAGAIPCVQNLCGLKALAYCAWLRGVVFV